MFLTNVGIKKIPHNLDEDKNKIEVNKSDNKNELENKNK